MRVSHILLASAMAIGLAGCQEGTTGGPGAVDDHTTTTSDSAATTDSGDATTTTPDAASTTDPSTSVEPAPTTIDPAPATTDPAPATTDAAPATSDPAATNDATVNNDENTFSLDAPNLTTDLKQGEQQIVSIGISRGSEFNQDVTLSFEGLPPGVTVDPEKPVIKAGDKEAKVTIKAAADAALNDHEIKIIGHPKTGKDATNTLNITVSKP